MSSKDSNNSNNAHNADNADNADFGNWKQTFPLPPKGKRKAKRGTEWEWFYLRFNKVEVKWVKKDSTKI